ncbi:Probable G-protein coupled receptor No9 [Eumeta japonica]|uniref:Probable G-protein coupled receptor No9 n=1 Tax=Eumeta variegata TaxID=151549 RepID=A0A4C1ZUC8_EUMVA|nr:Probable G-protein coupled receptor No9 [Eumeta japonica]
MRKRKEKVEAIILLEPSRPKNHQTFKLAVSQRSVGVTVVQNMVWIFGSVWCSVWLAVDVWMCTASILNLCAISLDRYVAVTRPVSYPSIMSRRRAKALIAGLWVLSFVICFPPLVGWKDSTPWVDQASCSSKEIPTTTLPYLPQGDEDESGNRTSILPPPPCAWTCELTGEPGYVLYSALGSFYIPMFVMLFFYWRIYKAAVRTTKAINQGFRTTKALLIRVRLCLVSQFIIINAQPSASRSD